MRLKLTHLAFLFSLVTVAFVSASFTSTTGEKVEKKADIYKYYIKGKILDKASNVEIGGAMVSVELKNVELASGPSGEDGTYEIKFEHTKKFTGSELMFVITRDGYNKKEATNVPVAPGVPAMINFKIERKPVRFKRDRNAKRWETIEYLKEVERW